jgi:hypothetical protein
MIVVPIPYVSTFKMTHIQVIVVIIRLVVVIMDTHIGLEGQQMMGIYILMVLTGVYQIV